MGNFNENNIKEYKNIIYWTHLEQIPEHIYKSIDIIVTPTSSLNHINISLVNKYGIKIFKLSDYPEFSNKISTTAEFTFSLILHAVHKLYLIGETLDRNSFDRKPLSQTTLGIIGLGRIGRKVAKYARALGLNVIFFDIDNSINDKNFLKSESIEELIKQSTVITLCARNDQPEFILNRKHFELFENKIFINTARGSLINERELIEALKNQINSLVFLDVIQREELFYNSDTALNLNDSETKKLIEQNRLFISPHAAGMSTYNLLKIEEFLYDELINLV